MRQIKLDRTGKNILFIILEGIAATCVLNLYNPFLQMFARRLGGNDLHIALVNSLPPLVSILVLVPCTILFERYNNRKKTALNLILANSLFYAAIALVPFVPDNIKVITYLILIGLMNGPASLYNANWQSFYSDSFKGSLAGRVYSLRGSLSTLFGLVTVLLTGYILSFAQNSEAKRIGIYQLFYVLCFLITLFQAFALSKVETPVPVTANEAENVPLRSKLIHLARNKPYAVYCLIAFAFHVSWQMGWPLFFIYNVEKAGLAEFQLGLINVAGGVTQFLFYPLWNKLIEKKGVNFSIIFAALGLAVNPLFYFKIWGVLPLIAINAYAGIFGAGFTITLFLGLLKILPEEGKTVYISVFNTVINISGFIAPLIGIVLYRATNIFIAFFIIGIIRIAATLLYFIRWYAGRKAEKADSSPTGLASSI